MLKLKGCVRCGGDLKVEETDWQCLQCGHYYYDGVLPGEQRGLEGRLDLLETLGLRPTAGGKWGRPEVVNLAVRRPKVPQVASSGSARRHRFSVTSRK